MILKDLFEHDADIGSAEEIAMDVFRLAEAHVAGMASEQNGHGFHRNAIAAEIDKILVEVKANALHLVKQ